MIIDPDNKPGSPDHSGWQDAGASRSRYIYTTKKKAKSGGSSRADATPVSVAFWDNPADAYEQFSDPAQWSSWDTAMLAGQRVPGVVRVHSRKRRKLLANGAIGANAEQLVDTGAEASSVEMTCFMWMEHHLAQYAALAKAIEVQSGTRKDPKALQVEHPGLKLLGIKSLYVTSMGVPMSKGPGQGYEVSIEAQEFKPINKSAAAKNNAALPVDQDVLNSKVPSKFDAGMGPSGDKSRSAP